MTVSAPNRSSAARWGVAALLAVYIGIRIWNLGAFCLDSDEVFSVTTARLDWSSLVPAVANDLVHPPLFYVLLKAWIVLGGTSLVWLRLLPCALSVAALIPLLALLRRLRLTPAASALALALVAVNGYQAYHARYVRMYALLFLLGLVSLLFFVAWLEEGGKRSLIALTTVNTLLVYAHYFGWMLILVEGIAVLWRERKRLRAFALSATIVAAGFAPWLIAIAHSTRVREGLEPNLRWARHPGFGDLAWFFTGLAGPLEPIPLAAALAVVWLAALAAGRARGVRHPRLLVLAAALPPLLSFVLSGAMAESVWGSRHLVLAAVPGMALLAASACALHPAWLRRGTIALLAAWLAWGAYVAVFRPEPQVNLEVLTRQLAARCAGEREVALYSLDRYLPAWMGYFLESERDTKWRLEAIADPRAATGDRFWLAYNEKFWRDARRPEQILRERGYDVGPGIWAADPWNRLVLVPVRRLR
ncbi:MAG TPA: glycosyltransferase family 39 protein [Bryobacteraceae bacterium]